MAVYALAVIWGRHLGRRFVRALILVQSGCRLSGRRPPYSRSPYGPPWFPRPIVRLARIWTGAWAACWFTGPMSPAAIGSGYALSAAFWGALFLIPYKALGAMVPQASAVWAMLFASALINTALIAWRRGWRLPLSRLSIGIGLLLAACTVLGNVAMAMSLSLVQPAVTSVVVQVQIIMVALGELLILRGRLSPAVILGAILGLIGFVVMQAPAGGGWDAAALHGGLWAVVAAAAFAAMLLITKSVIHRIDVLALNMLRLWCAVFALALWPGALGGLADFSPWLWFLAFAAAFCGPTLGRLHLMQAVRFISASQAKLLTLASPPFALLLGWLAFSATPAVHESIGGLIILAGVALPLLQWWRQRSDGPQPAIDPAVVDHR